MARVGADEKVIPDAKELPILADARYQNQLREMIKTRILKRINIDDMVDQAAADLGTLFPLYDARQWIEDGFEINRVWRWSDVLAVAVNKRLSQCSDKIEDAIDSHLGGES